VCCPSGLNPTLESPILECEISWYAEKSANTPSVTSSTQNNSDGEHDVLISWSDGTPYRRRCAVRIGDRTSPICVRQGGFPLSVVNGNSNRYHRIHCGLPRCRTYQLGVEPLVHSSHIRYRGDLCSIPEVPWLRVHRFGRQTLTVRRSLTPRKSRVVTRGCDQLYPAPIASEVQR